MKQFVDVNEARRYINQKQDCIDTIISRDLDGITGKKTVGTWLEHFGRLPEKQDTKLELLDLERNIIDANLYLRHKVTKFDFNIGTELNETFF